jgi:hypothetical protein
MQKNINLTVDTVTKRTVVDSSNIRKGDTLLLTIKLYASGSKIDTTNQKIVLILKKPDNTIYEKEITGASNIVTATLNEQATIVTGVVEGEVQLIDTDSVTISNKFQYTVDQSLASNIIANSINSIETLANIEELIADYDLNASTMQTENAETVANISSLTTTNNNATTLKSELEIDIETGNILKTNLETENTKADNNINILQSSTFINEIETARGTYVDLNARLEADKTNVLETTSNNLNALSSKVGDISTLTTTDKTNIVKSINENVNVISVNTRAISALDATKANVIQEALLTPTLLNGWVDFSTDYPARYWKDTLGNVHLCGMVKGGIGNMDLFVLPVGYRPASVSIRNFIGRTSTSTFMSINISGSNGKVSLLGTTGTYVSLDGISFRSGV